MTGSEPARQIRAVLHIQWLSVVNSLRRRSERFGLVLSVLVGILWYGLWTTASAGVFAMCLLSSDDRLAQALPAILFFVLVYWQLTPLLTASMGVSVDLHKLAVYPIAVRTLFVVECLLRLVTGSEMALLLAGLTLGMTVRAPLRAPLFLPAVLLFVAFNLLLSAGLRNLLERVLQRRRVREILVFVLVMASLTPQLLLWSSSGGIDLSAVARGFGRAARFLPQSLMPSSALADAYLGSSGPADWLVLGAWCAAAAVFGYRQFRRSFRGDYGASARPAAAAASGETLRDRLYRLPGRLLPDPLAALAEKELRYYWRSPRFRLLFIMGFSFGVVAWLPFAMRRGMSSAGPLQSSFLTLLSLYALLMIGQVTFLNSFGFDRSAARYLFWMPVSPLRVLLAKNLVALALVLLETMLLALVCRLLGMGVGGWQLLEALGVTAICCLYLFSAGNFTSLMFAAPLSPERASRGAGRGIHGVIVLLYPVLIAPVIVAYLIRYYWGSLQGYALMLAISAGAGIAVYAISLPLAARLGHSRRERLLEDLCRGEGPLVAD